MMKAHGIQPNATPSRSFDNRNVKSEREKHSHTPSVKKRKVVEFSEDQGAQDDEENFGGSVKQDPEANMDELQVKEEPHCMPTDNSIISGGNLMAYSMPDVGVGDVYGTGGSYYEPSTDGYNTPANVFGGVVNGGHLYDLHGSPPQFLNFSPYQDHSETESQDTPASHANRYQGDHIVIAD
jgi:hypothetical protein